MAKGDNQKKLLRTAMTVLTVEALLFGFFFFFFLDLPANMHQIMSRNFAFDFFLFWWKINKQHKKKQQIKK